MVLACRVAAGANSCDGRICDVLLRIAGRLDVVDDGVGFGGERGERLCVRELFRRVASFRVCVRLDRAADSRVLQAGDERVEVEADAGRILR